MIKDLEINALYIDRGTEPEKIGGRNHDGHLLLALTRYYSSGRNIWAGHWLMWCQQCQEKTIVHASKVSRLEKVASLEKAPE